MIDEQEIEEIEKRTKKLKEENDKKERLQKAKLALKKEQEKAFDKTTLGRILNNLR